MMKARSWGRSKISGQFHFSGGTQFTYRQISRSPGRKTSDRLGPSENWFWGGRSTAVGEKHVSAFWRRAQLSMMTSTITCAASGIAEALAAKQLACWRGRAGSLATRRAFPLRGEIRFESFHRVLCYQEQVQPKRLGSTGIRFEFQEFEATGTKELELTRKKQPRAHADN